jgi:hypothetical protein
VAGACGMDKVRYPYKCFSGASLKEKKGPLKTPSRTCKAITETGLKKEISGLESSG